MTDYSPLHDAAEETDGPITVADMNEAGYDDYDAGDRIIDVQMHITTALHALKNANNNPERWRAVNELVAALDTVDSMWNIETQIGFEGNELQVTIEEGERL